MRRRSILRCALTVVAPTIWLVSCASPIALKNDFTDYPVAFAESSNKQLLMNLARLSNDNPAYFVQLGNISSQHQFTAGAGFNSSGTRTSPVGLTGNMGRFVQRALTLGGSANAGLTETPIFQFLPLTGSNLVAAFLTPLSDKILATFYDQMWSADRIIRVMVQSVEHKKIGPDGKPEYEYWVNNPHHPTYPKFLEFCINMHDAQVSRALTVELNGATNTHAFFRGGSEKLADVVAAVKDGFIIEPDDSTTNRVIVTQVHRGVARASKNIDVSSDSLCLGELERKAVLRNDQPTNKVYRLLTSATNFAKDYAAGQYSLSMRTFEAAMYSVAYEEKDFNLYARTKKHPSKDIVFRMEDDGPSATVTRGDGTSFRVTPIMTLTYDVAKHRPPLASRLVQVNYGTNTYMVVADREIDSNQNGVVFTMLSYLFTQAAISTQNLPVQQFIQVQ